MYQAVTFRLSDVPFPVTQYTADHPEVHVMAFNVARDPDSPLPSENIYLVRAPTALHDEIRGLFGDTFDMKQEIPTTEPGTLLMHARFRFQGRGPIAGFLRVLAEALGTILEFRPIVIQDGNITVSALALPRHDSQLRLRAIVQYAKEKGLGFDILDNHPVPVLPIRDPRLSILDLLEWQVLQCYAGLGLYDVDSPNANDGAFLAAADKDLAEDLELDVDEVRQIRRDAERKVLNEFTETRAFNLRLAQIRLDRDLDA